MTPASALPEHSATPRRPWTPFPAPDTSDPTLPPVTVVLDRHDEQAFMTSAFAAHRPSHGRITVHPTPAAAAPAYLAHDLLRALGKHLPTPHWTTEAPWASHTDKSWRVAAAWIHALKVTHLLVCRAHRITARNWEHLLALRERARLHLTLLCNGPLPPAPTRLLAGINHQRLDTLTAARQHWHPSHPPQPATGYPWWKATAAFPPKPDEPWFRLPPQPRHPRPGGLTRSTRAQPTDPIPSAVLPVPIEPRQHDTHPSIVEVAARIHTRIAHPVHAASVAVRVLTGRTPRQIGHLHGSELKPSGTDSKSRGPRLHLPTWTTPLMDAALALADLRGDTDVPNPLRIPIWEENEIEDATAACRLIPSPPARRS